MPSRSYHMEVVSRLKGLDKIIIGEIERHPVFCIRLGKRGKPKVLISAGMHGNEPAAVYALIEFIRKYIKDYDYRFYIYPCINPTGFESCTRLNHEGVDINRNFKPFSRVQEVSIIKRHLRKGPKAYALTIDMHEDDPLDGQRVNGFYLYENSKERKLGRKIINNISRYFPVCRDKTIEGDINDNGVIYYPEACRNTELCKRTSFDAFLSKKYTNQSLVTETPVLWLLERRIKAHLIALKTALNELSEPFSEPSSKL
ncbi:MAG: M14 family metallocarboxypeptidase [Candidatus Woesearchaeota archaeon]